jgi:hypothetical protein
MKIECEYSRVIVDIWRSDAIKTITEPSLLRLYHG